MPADGRRIVVREPVHYAVVRDGPRVTLFVDGVRSRRNQQRYPALEFKSLTGASLGAQLREFENDVPVTHRCFRGIIDEVRVSTVARYKEDFVPQKRFEADAHTQALYHFDEGEGNTLHDASGNELHGTIYGAAWVGRQVP